MPRDHVLRKTAMPTGRKKLAGLVNRGRPKMPAREDIKGVAAAAPEPRPEKAFVLPRQKDEKPAAGKPQKYARLDIRIVAKELRISALREVDGSFAEPRPVGAYVWEVLAGGKRIAAGAIPDLGAVRGFAPPGQERRGHQVRADDEPTFPVRIANAPSAALLARSTLRFYAVRRELEPDSKQANHRGWPGLVVELLLERTDLRPPAEPPLPKLPRKPKRGPR